MVAIKDMALPTCCINCGILGKEKIYCSIYPRKDLDIITVTTNRPNWCPLIEIEERKVGKWVKYKTTEKYDYMGDRVTVSNYQCSECGRMIHDIGDAPLTNKLKDYPFCHCGADMRGAENE